MRKIWPLLAFVFTAVCILLITVYYSAAPKAKPELKIEFNNSPPWIIKPGQNLTLSIAIKNEGKAAAKNVDINFTISTSFKILQSGTNQFRVKFSEIKPKETKILPITITSTTAITPGNYPFTLIVQADNASQLTFSDKITVQLPT